jgi:hypothetical protein
MSNPTQPETTTSDHSDMEAMLRQAAQRTDDGEAVDLAALSAGAQSDPSGQNKTTASTPPAAPSNHALQPQAEGKQQAQPGTEPSAGDQPVKDKTGNPSPTAYEKAKQERERKDQERFDRNWKRLEQDRLALAERERALAERERRLQQAPRPAASQPERPAAESEFTPEQWESAAETWEKAGKFDLADAAKEKARQLREQPASRPSAQQRPAREAAPAPSFSQDPAETPDSPEFRTKWSEHLAALTAEHPDLRDPKSELYQATAQVLRADPRFHRFNDGIRAAFEVAQLTLKAGKAAALEAKVKEQEQELAKLRAATAPGTGGPESQPKAKAFEDMTSAEQEKYLREMAATAER